MKLYRCENETCHLGGVYGPGHFTGGPSAEAVSIVTGEPYVLETDENGEVVRDENGNPRVLQAPEHYGEGVCPNCCKPGVEVIENEE